MRRASREDKAAGLVRRLDLPSDYKAPALIGVSGGLDSVTLLDLLLARGCLELTVCHLDHALRPDSKEDAAFVQRLAEERKLAFVGGRKDVARAARTRQVSIETAARDVRYEFFSRSAKSRACARIYLAHHADDQVETFLFNLFRGAGPAGLAGMRSVSERPSLQVARPLLGIWRQELQEYAAARRLEWRCDASNLDGRHTRNRMRNELIPEIERIFGRDVRAGILRAAEILRVEDELLATVAAAAGDGLTASEIAVTAVRELPLALQRRAVQGWLRACGVKRIDFEATEKVRLLALREKPARVNLALGWHARRRGGKLSVERPTPGHG